MSSIAGKAPSLKLPPQIETARELLLAELGRLLTIETTLAQRVLPKLLGELTDDELTKVVKEHLEQTRSHVGNVQKAFDALGEAPAGKPAYGLDGLRTEHEATAPHVVPGARPAVQVAAAMGTEHYEINAYEAAIRLAEALGEKKVVKVLRRNLEQDVEALEKLGKQAERLAKAAVEDRTYAP